MDKGLWQVSNRIHLVEGFPVRLGRWPKSSSDDIPFYNYARAISHKTTIDTWKQSRFFKIYPRFDCHLEFPNGDPVDSEDTTVGEIRDAYRGIQIYESGRSLYFKFEGSEPAIFEVKRWFNSIGYLTKYQTESFLWMKSYLLVGSIQSIFLFPFQFEALNQRMREIAVAFGVEVSTDYCRKHGEDFPLCLPQLDFYSEESLLKLTSAIV
jgi:hypothetical protein